MARLLQDSFDAVPVNAARQGTHRIARSKRSGWYAFAWAALATGVLVALGVVGLFAINDRNQFTDVFRGGAVETPPTPTPTVQPTTNPALAVTVLNGTDVTGLATRVGTAMAAAGWKIDAKANANDDTVKVTTVYYVDAVNEGAALGLARDLGGVRVTQSEDFQGAALTVVLGADYAGPGLE